jgi:hypothetical protein
VFQGRWYGFVAKHRTGANQHWLDAMYGKFFLGMPNVQRTAAD